MGFRVIPASVPASTEEWRKALDAPASELPPLTEAQMSEVRQFSLKQEEYQRLRVLLRQYVLERQFRQGTEFGDLIEEMIRPYGNRYSLATISRRGTPLGWRVTIRDDKRGIVEFQCPLQVVEAVTSGSASSAETEGLRHNILAELGQSGPLDATG